MHGQADHQLPVLHNLMSAYMVIIIRDIHAKMMIRFLKQEIIDQTFRSFNLIEH